VQLRLPSKLTSEEYITREGWHDASLQSCPEHPKGGCGFRSCGSYERKEPRGLRIRRWYCPEAHLTFSLVPDFAAARVASTLLEVAQAVARFEAERERGQSVEQAAAAVRPDIEPAGALRWVRRRRAWVSAAFAALVGIAPELLAGCEPTVASMRLALGGDCLVRAREIVVAQLAHVPAPLGFAPLVRRGVLRVRRRAHAMGPDPPRSGA
jgi:hypothetical protein